MGMEWENPVLFCFVVHQRLRTMNNVFDGPAQGTKQDMFHLICLGLSRVLMQHGE